MVPTRLAAIARFGIGLAVMVLVALPLACAANAAAAPAMTARVLMQGHARVGAWMAIEIHLTNDGPAVTGEVRLAGGSLGQTHFATAVDLPTRSDKTYLLYAQPPAFGQELKVELISGGSTIATSKVAFVTHDAGQLVVGVVAERPQGIVGELALQPSPSGAAAVTVSLGVSDLPDRVEGWNVLDRLVWQDVDTNALTPGQLAALRGWLATGGRLIVVGGTAGPSALSNLPDEVLPYRPATTIDAPPSSLTGLVGQLPRDAADIPALTGPLSRGHVLASVGDQAIAAEAAYGSGSVTILGFDPSTSWLATSKSAEGLWRRLIPQRSGGGPLISTDDSQIVNAVTQLPALALPPIGGLLALLAAYIVLIGPLNYMVLRRIDRREWAWATMPALIGIFAVAAYGFGSVLRGTDVIVSQVAVVRGAPDATEGAAQVYFGIFSPSRGSYQVQVPGGALLSSPISGDFGGGTTSSIDVLQGDPARIRDLAVGFGSLRTVRADSSTTVPRVSADLQLRAGQLMGTVKNLSTERLENVAVVLGGSVAVLGDLEPGAERAVALTLGGNPTGESLSDRIVGQPFSNGIPDSSEATQRAQVRHSILDQLTFDPNFGNSSQLQAEGPVLLAWDSRSVLDVRIADQQPRQIGNVLYYVPIAMGISGPVAFSPDLMRSSIVASDASFFKGGPSNFDQGAAFGAGSVTVAYRPVAFQGSLAVSKVELGLNFGGPGAQLPGTGKPIEPLPSIPVSCPATGTAPAGCLAVVQDNLPEIEVFDRTGSGTWVRLPHVTAGTAYDLAAAGRYVDPGTGTLLVRFVNAGQDSVGFSFSVSITGDVK